MIDVSVTTGEMQQCLAILKKADRFVSAVNLAVKMCGNGCRETQRRHVRAIVDRLRKDGVWVVANGSGYFLTDDESVWLDYCEGRKIDAKKIIGKAHRRQKMITSDRGQGLLFVPPATSAIGTY